MASVEISLLTGLKPQIIFYIVIIDSLCSFSLTTGDIVAGSNKKDHTEYCWEFTWTAPCCCCLSICLRSPGSLRVARLTPASPAFYCGPLAVSRLISSTLRPSVAASEHQVCHITDLNWPISSQPREPKSTSPRITYKDLNPGYWRFLPGSALIPTSLGSNLSWGPLGLLWDSLRTWEVINSSPSYLVWSFLLRGTETFHRLPQSHFNEWKFWKLTKLQLKVFIVNVNNM